MDGAADEAVGKTLGCVVGIIDGVNDGFDVGIKLGFVVGISVGFSVGISLGYIVGNTVGFPEMVLTCTVGAGLGMDKITGLAVGSLDGAGEGEAENILEQSIPGYKFTEFPEFKFATNSQQLLKTTSSVAKNLVIELLP